MSRGGLQVGGNYRGIWDTDVFYVAHDIVRQGSTLYSARVDHNSGDTFDAALWDTLPGGAGAVPADATTTAKGVVRIAGDLGGSADNPTVPGLAGKENTVNKGAANGYAPLNSSSRVPIANLASGTPDGTKFVRDDGTLAKTGAPRIVTGGTLGPAYSLDVGGDKEVWLTGTMNTNTTVTLAGLTAGATVRLLLTQDSTGGRTLALSDGTSTTAISIPTGSNATIDANLYTPDGSTVYVDVSGAYAATAARRDAWGHGFAQTLPLWRAPASQAALTPGTLRLIGGLEIPQGEVVSTMGTLIASTPTKTNLWYALVRRSDMAVLAKTADDGATARATNDDIPLACDTPWVAPVDTPCYFGIVCVGSVMPNLFGVTLGSGYIAVPPLLVGNSTPSLTDPSSLGATASPVAAGTAFSYAYVN